VLTGRVVRQVSRRGVPADQLQGLDHRSVRGVAGPELEHLFGDELDDFIRRLPTTSREPTPVGEELQQQREAQPGRARLVAQPRHLVRQKREVLDVLDELVQLQPTRRSSPSGG